DQRDAPSQARPGELREFGPGCGVGGNHRGQELRFALQLARDLLFEVSPQQQIRSDDRSDYRGGHEQGDAREQPRGELHERRLAPDLAALAGGAACGGSRKRYPTARTVSIQSPASPSLVRSRWT